MQLYFRFVKRPGESHLALDGKKEQRVMAKQTVEVKNLLQYIKDVPEKTWREEREARETSIHRDFVAGTEGGS